MPRIALIEDEPDMRELISEELEDQGHEVHTATNGQDGLALIQRLKPDIVLADINMPKMNGFQMRTVLRDRHPDLAKIPFVFVSAFADKNDVADGLVVGADHYITKPIDFNMLNGWIKTLTRQ
jgi:DNA-binding response OmpR family regulator